MLDGERLWEEIMHCSLGHQAAYIEDVIPNFYILLFNPWFLIRFNSAMALHLITDIYACHLKNERRDRVKKYSTGTSEQEFGRLHFVNP